MARQLCMAVVVELPPDPFDAADVFAQVRKPWTDLLTTMQQAGVKHDAKVDEMEVRAKPGPRTGTKRKPRSPTVADVRGIIQESAA